MSAVPAPSTDGRVERRERNRAAVVEALLALYRQGQLAPSADAIARQAGVSPRSLFRYFDDIDALVREAVRQQQAHIAPRLPLDLDPALPFAERVERVVEHRLALYDAMGHVARVARTVASEQPPVREELHRLRAVLRDQLAVGFAPEIEARGAGALAAADVITSWESVDLLRDDQGLGRGEVVAALTTGLRGVLG